MTKRCDRLVVLQTKAQATDYQNNRRLDGDLVLPIGPEAMYEADVNRWAFCNLGDLWTREQDDAEREASRNALEALIDMLNAYSRRLNPDRGLEIGNYYAFQLWVIIGQIRHNNFIAASIAKNLRPAKVLCYTKANPVTFMGLRPDPDCIFADALSESRLFQEGRCEILRIPEKVRVNTSREKILSLLPVSLRALMRSLRDRNLYRNSNSPTHSVLVIGGAGDWNRLNRDPAFSSVFRQHRPPELKADGKATPSQELFEILNTAIQRETRGTEGPGGNVSDLAAAIQTDVELFSQRCSEVSKQMSNYDAVLTAVLTFPIDNFLAHMAARAGRPVVVWQHGEKGQAGFDPLNVYTELYYATDYFAYAPAVAEQYRPWIGKNRLTNVIAVGSIEKRVEWQGGNTIVYATGKWFKTTLPIDTDRRLYNAHTSILSYLNTLGDRYSIIMKANNTPGLNDIPYRYDNVRVEFAKPFTECLKKAKVVILDTPATTLVEACSTRVPIFVLGGRSKYTPEFLDVIKRRVVWSETVEDLLRRLAAFLEYGTYEADVNDQTYLCQYGANKEAADVAESVRTCLLNSIARANNNKF